MSTFAQIRTRAAVRYSDPSNVLITDTAWKDYVNEAYRDFLTLNPRLPFNATRSTSITIAANGRSSNLPTDVWRVTAVWDATDLQPLVPLTNPAQPRWEYPSDTEQGVPQQYRLFGRALEVYPRPAQLTTFAVDYYLQPADLSADGDLPAFPAAYHGGIIALAVSKAYRDDGNANAAKEYESEASGIMDRMLDDLLDVREDRYPGITDEFYG